MPVPRNRAAAVYRPFDPLRHALLALRHLKAMSDPALGGLPYGTVEPYRTVPFAEHTRRDDSEYVASWLEGLSCAREMTGSTEADDAIAALRAILLDPACWDDATGIRYPSRRSWTGPTDYCTVSECGAVLSALARLVETDPSDTEARERGDRLVAALAASSVKHVRRLVPEGAFDLPEPVRFFASDTFVRGKGLVPELSTGYADWTMRTMALLFPVMRWYAATGSAETLEFARDFGNFATGFSHFFGTRTEFQGDVHSALVAAAGLARLGRVLSRDRYVARAKAIYDYVRRNSTSFGWVPEFLHWQMPSEQRCDAVCTADMLVCALELVGCNFPEYWDDANSFWRNHLARMQFEDVSFVPKPAKRPRDTQRRTYRDIRERLLGGFCGSATPSFVFLGEPRIVSPRGAAAAPCAMLAAWKRVLETNRDLVTVNFPVNRESPELEVKVGYPNAGLVEVRARKACRLNIRVFPWMGGPYEGTVDGRPAAVERREDHLVFPKLRKGSVVIFRHDPLRRNVLENVTSLDYYGIWRGPDTVDVLPHAIGTGYRIYQCDTSIPREPITAAENDSVDSPEPFCEPPVARETRLNRRKAPRT